jgi:hypothetical protein
MVAGLGQTYDNEDMVIFEAVLVFGMVFFVFYGVVRLLTRTQDHTRPVVRGGQWRAAHYDVEGQTRVVLQRVSTGGEHVLDEHVIATLRVDDAEYDAKFLSAMSTARERRALFESEAE